MDMSDLPRLIFLLLLVVAIGGSFLVTNRNSLSTTMQQAAIWVLIFIGAIAGVGLWNDVQQSISPSQTYSGTTIELPRGFDDHFTATLDINGTEVTFLVDTGATEMVLSLRDAARVGIDTSALDFIGRAQTANGIVRTAPVTLDVVRIGPIIDQDVRAVVNEGDISASLLGMSYLSLFENIEIQGTRMLLTR